jgi:hypothetical protein
LPASASTWVFEASESAAAGSGTGVSLNDVAPVTGSRLKPVRCRAAVIVDDTRGAIGEGGDIDAAAPSVVECAVVGESPIVKTGVIRVLEPALSPSREVGDNGGLSLAKP